MEFKYDAFISYSRRNGDFAILLHRGIENGFSKLHKRFRTKKTSVLIALDTEDLNTGEDLSAEIREKVQSSRHLIVICSKDSKSSPWVNKEIAFFKQLRSNDSSREIIAILHDLPEEITEQDFPQQLLDDENIPLGIEAREKIVKKKKIRFKKHFETNILYHIYAHILNVDFTDLKNRQEIYRRYIQKRRAIILIGLAFFIISSFLVVIIQRIEPHFIVSKKIINPLPLNIFSSAIALRTDTSFFKGDDSGTIFHIDKNGHIIDSLVGFSVQRIKIFDDKYLFGVALNSSELLMWRIRDKKLIGKLINPDSKPFTCFTYAKDNNIIAVGDSEGTVFIFNGKTIKRMKFGNKNSGKVQDLAFFDNKTKLAFCFLNETVGYYDITTQNIYYLNRDAELKIEVLFGLRIINDNILVYGWSNKLNKNLILKLEFKKAKELLMKSQSTFGGIYQVSNTNKFITFNWDGDIKIFNINENSEIASIFISDMQEYFENPYITLDYNDEINTICVYSNKEIYLINVEWRSIFGIKGNFLKHL